MYVNQKLLDAIECKEPVEGLTHGFYRYPARFSPQFVKTAIETFSEPGDVILDPFMGGGTTAVEARVSGRHFVGTDLNSLAVFLARTKATQFTPKEIVTVRNWVEDLVPNLKITTKAEQGELTLNMSNLDTWRIRKIIHLCLSKLSTLETNRTRALARCIILRTSQWALDCRRDLPPVSTFKEQVLEHAEEILSGTEEFSKLVRNAQRNLGSRVRMRFVQCSASDVARQSVWSTFRPPRLVVTSPPYPGVHVLYHRWQIRGRKETPAPFWITGTLDGNGPSFYTFGGRKQKDLDVYFQTAVKTFSSVASVCDSDSLVVQMVSFSDTNEQLPRYLEAMEAAGLREVKITTATQTAKERIWRRVPHRKWYAQQLQDISSSSEVVLFHRKRSSC